MQFVKLVKDINKKKENQKQKTKADLNRESGDELIHALKKVGSSMLGIKNPEARRVFTSVNERFVQYISNTTVIGEYDLAEMDAILLAMIEIYNEALNDGDFDTVRRGVTYIQTALLEYRKELNTLEKARKEAVVRERIEMMETYKAVLKISRAVFINKCNVEKKQEEYAKLYGKYKELFEKVKKERMEHPSIYESLQSIRPGIDKIPNNAQEMSTDITNLRLMKGQKEDLASDMNLYFKEYNTHQSTLKSMETRLTSKNGILTKEEETQIHKVIDDYHQRMQQISMEIETLIGIEKKRHAYVEEVMSSMAFGKEAMESVRAFEEMLREEELEQEDAARAIEIQKNIENQNKVMHTN